MTRRKCESSSSCSYEYSTSNLDTLKEPPQKPAPFSGKMHAAALGTTSRRQENNYYSIIVQIIMHNFGIFPPSKKKKKFFFSAQNIKNKICGGKHFVECRGRGFFFSILFFLGLHAALILRAFSLSLSLSLLSVRWRAIFFFFFFCKVHVILFKMKQVYNRCG